MKGGPKHVLDCIRLSTHSVCARVGLGDGEREAFFLHNKALHPASVRVQASPSAKHYNLQCNRCFLRVEPSSTVCGASAHTP